MVKEEGVWIQSLPPGTDWGGGRPGVWSLRGLGGTLLGSLTSWGTQVVPLGSAQDFLDQRPHWCVSPSQQYYLSDDLGGDCDLGGTVMGAGRGTETSPPPQYCRF